MAVVAAMTWQAWISVFHGEFAERLHRSCELEMAHLTGTTNRKRQQTMRHASYHSLRCIHHKVKSAWSTENVMPCELVTIHRTFGFYSFIWFLVEIENYPM